MKYSTEEIACLWLDSFFADAPLKFRLLEVAESPLEFASNLEKFSSVLIKSGKECLYNNMKDSLNSNFYAKNLVGKLEQEGIRAITLCSKQYPEELRQLKEPPLVLYAKGNTELLSGEKFTIVGSRRTQPTVMKRTEQTSETLSEYCTVVSGIADGGDSAALLGGLKSGRVISVLPFGHGCVSSPAIALYREVCKKGLVVSEYPLSYQAKKHSFLVRNRILAALGRGVLAVSAGKRSGVLNTCSHALELGRDVFAFPYSPGVESGIGCNQLIKNGAYLCDDVKDILLTYEWESGREETSPEEENEIVKLLKEYGELHIYELAERSKRNLETLSAALLLLEMEGKVVKTGGNKYSAV